VAEGDYSTAFHTDTVNCTGVLPNPFFSLTPVLPFSAPLRLRASLVLLLQAMTEPPNRLLPQRRRDAERDCSTTFQPETVNCTGYYPTRSSRSHRSCPSLRLCVSARVRLCCSNQEANHQTLFSRRVPGTQRRLLYYIPCRNDELHNTTQPILLARTVLALLCGSASPRESGLVASRNAGSLNPFSPAGTQRVTHRNHCHSVKRTDTDRNSPQQ